MIVIVDSNVLFSSAISPNGKIAELLMSPAIGARYISCYYVVADLFKHQPKIVQLSKQPVEKVVSTLYVLLQKVELVNEAIIEPHFWMEVDRLTRDVDSFDISCVALTLKMQGWLWAGDKKLSNHLRKMRFEQVINTNELYEKLA